MRLTSNMLNVLKTLHTSDNNRGVASYRTAIALSDRKLVRILNGGFPAITQGLAFPELSINLTEEGLLYCKQRFNSTG